jgi:hypothetical protein
VTRRGDRPRLSLLKFEILAAPRRKDEGMTPTPSRDEGAMDE